MDVDRIYCGGRNVIPGLIVSHWHAMLASVNNIVAMTQDVGVVHLPAGRETGAPCSAALPRSATSAARPIG